MTICCCFIYRRFLIQKQLRGDLFQELVVGCHYVIHIFGFFELLVQVFP